MKRVIACLLLAVMVFAGYSAAFADGFAGWWTDDVNAYYFSEDGIVQIWELENIQMTGAYFSTVEEEGDGWKFYPFTSAIYYTQRFAEEDGWMALVDEHGEMSSWLNSTPENVANEGLALRENMPLVGVWTQMTDDLTAPCFQFYDDGYFDYADLLEVEQSEQLFGKYQLENGLLTLYTEDTGLNWILSLLEDEKLLLQDGENQVVMEKFAPAGYFPSADELIGTWKNEESAITFFEDGTMDMNGISGYGVWSLNGGRLIISSDDPLWSFAAYVHFDPQNVKNLVFEQASGGLTSVFSKE